jgi:hypothetical protein
VCLLTPGFVSAAGNISGGNLISSGQITAVGNIQGANVRSLGVMFGNVCLLTPGFVSAAGNVIVGGLITATGNISGGNLRTAGSISATGNITGNFILGNGSQLTGLQSFVGATGPQGIQGNTGATGIQGVTGNIGATGIQGVTGNIGATGIQGTAGNIGATGVAGTAGNIGATGVAGTQGNIGATGVAGTQGNIGATGTFNGTLTSNIAGAGFSISNVAVVAATTLISSTGNVQGGNLRTAGLVSATGTITGSALTVGVGNVTCGNIVNSNANGVGNIGSSSLYFNTVFAKATSAQYADLAEMYSADADYPPGTVVEFGGTKEVTISTASHSTQVAGIISTNPSYLMNAALVCASAVEVALVGRVPCRVIGTIFKGDRLVASDLAGVATVLDQDLYEPGCIIGKALEEYNSDQVGTIEVAVGRI